MKTVKIIWVPIVIVVAMTTMIHAEDFTLSGNEHRDVATKYDNGWLYDYSSASVLVGGIPRDWYSGGVLYAYDNSNVVVSGGFVKDLYAYGNSKVAVTSGVISGEICLSTHDNSKVDMSGGVVTHFNVRDNSSVAVSGGSPISLGAGNPYSEFLKWGNHLDGYF